MFVKIVLIMRSVYYPTVRGRYKDSEGGIRFVCRKSKYFKMHLAALKWANHMMKTLRWDDSSENGDIYNKTDQKDEKTDTNDIEGESGD